MTVGAEKPTSQALRTSKGKSEKLKKKIKKKSLTNNQLDVIIIIESEREVNNMEELARKYERKHAGHVTKITNYSFEFETVPNKDGKVEKYVVMLSYFLKL